MLPSNDALPSLTQEQINSILTIDPRKPSHDDDVPDYYGSEYSGQPSPASPPTPVEVSAKKASSKKSQKKKKNAIVTSPLDVIDTLDTIGGFHHDGPFDAASSHRNRTSSSRNPSRQAPMLAFDPSALDPVAQMRLDKGPMRAPLSASAIGSRSTMDLDSSRLSPNLTSTFARAQGGGGGGESYPIRRTTSDQSTNVTMGFPVGKIASDPKAAKLAEAFGIQDREAWEDFGQVRYAPDPSRESMFVSDSSLGEFGSRQTLSPARDTTFNKRLDRSMKVASVWDMEATLKHGRPVGVAPPMPAMPPMPLEYAGSSGRGSGQPEDGVQPPLPRRSKSLINRFRKAGHQSEASNGGTDDFTLPGSTRRQRERSSSAAITASPTSPTPLSPYSLQGRSPTDQSQFINKPRRPSVGNKSLSSPKMIPPHSPLSPMLLSSSPKLSPSTSPSLQQSDDFSKGNRGSSVEEGRDDQVERFATNGKNVTNPGLGFDGVDVPNANPTPSSGTLSRKASLFSKMGLGKKNK